MSAPDDLSKYPEPFFNFTPELLSVAAFSRELLPSDIAEWCYDVTERAGCPVDFVATGFLVSASSVIGTQVLVYPKRYDEGFKVVPNLWGGVVGPPGVMKTLTISEPSRPVRDLNLLAKDQFEQELAVYRRERDKFKIVKSALEQLLKKAIKDDDASAVKGLQFRLDALNEPKRPVQRIYVTNDSTVEKIQVTLSENPNGILVFRDELNGLFRSMEKEGHQGEREFYNQAWVGTDSFLVQRMERGNLYVPRCCLSILGSIQPDVLERYLREAFDGVNNDGFIQRFQIAVYPDISKDYELVDRPINQTLKRRMDAIFEALSDLRAHGWGGEEDDPITLHFDPAAQDFFDSWLTRLEKRLRSGQDHPVFTSHLSKYRSLMPSIAVILHLVETILTGPAAAPISLRAATMAAAWCEYLESHARRIYAIVTRGRGVSAAVMALSTKIRTKALSHPFTVRDVLRGCWAGLTDKEIVLAAIEELVDYHWIWPIHRPAGAKGGRPTESWGVNPRVFGFAAQGGFAVYPPHADENFQMRGVPSADLLENYLSIYLKSLKEGAPVEPQNEGVNPRNLGPKNLLQEGGSPRETHSPRETSQGLEWGEMTPEQRAAWDRPVDVAGVETALAQIREEAVERAGRRATRRGKRR